MTTTTTPIPERLALLPKLPIRSGNHRDVESGGGCGMNLVAWLAGEPDSDHPECADPAITAALISLNDRIRTDERRAELLRDILPRVVGTRGTAALTDARRWAITDWVVRDFTPMVFDWSAEQGNKSLTAHAAALRALPKIDSWDAIEATSEVRAAARAEARGLPGWASYYDRRRAARRAFVEAFKEKWAAAADAAAGAGAAAAADADADADAAAGAGAAAAAAAVADAAAVAVAGAAAVAVAVADADADAAAGAGAAAGAALKAYKEAFKANGGQHLGYSATYDLVYGEARPAYEKALNPKWAEFRGLVEQARADMLLRLIDMKEPDAQAGESA